MLICRYDKVALQEMAWLTWDLAHYTTTNWEPIFKLILTLQHIGVMVCMALEFLFDLSG